MAKTSLTPCPKSKFLLKVCAEPLVNTTFGFNLNWNVLPDNEMFVPLVWELSDNAPELPFSEVVVVLHVPHDIVIEPVEPETDTGEFAANDVTPELVTCTVPVVPFTEIPVPDVTA